MIFCVCFSNALVIPESDYWQRKTKRLHSLLTGLCDFSSRPKDIVTESIVRAPWHGCQHSRLLLLSLLAVRSLGW